MINGTDVWNEMSYRRYANRKNELWNEQDDCKNKILSIDYDTLYKEHTFSVEDLFYFDYDEVE